MLTTGATVKQIIIRTEHVNFDEKVYINHCVKIKLDRPQFSGFAFRN
jgi:hypothetical protein